MYSCSGFTQIRPNHVVLVQGQVLKPLIRRGINWYWWGRISCRVDGHLADHLDRLYPLSINDMEVTR